jgi:16S rRNA (cytosine967-C5)-methyltransferase
MDTFTNEERSTLYQAFLDVTKRGHYLSSEIDLVFKLLSPSADKATYYRSLLFQAIRYNDFAGAVDGAYDEASAPGKMYMPEWMREALVQSLGENFDYFVSQSLTNAPVFIRVNTLKTTASELVSQLSSFNASVVSNECLLIGSPYGLFRSDAFAYGYFEQQDINSQRVTESLDVGIGMRVVDACAGNGGKTLHIAAKMKNRGTLVALDIDPNRLDVLHERAKRAGIDNIDKRQVSSTKVIKRIEGTADRVLIDAPCTGTGVLRRNPDILYHLSERSFDTLITLQRDILHRNALIAKPGGRVVYAVCSVLAEEGEQQVQKLLEDSGEFILVEEWKTLPGDDGGDGFYCAVITRSGRA